MFAWDVLQTPNMEAGATAPKEADRTLLVRTTASGCYTAVDPTQLEAGGATSAITLDVASTPHKAGAAVDPGVKNVVRGAPVVLRGMQDGRSLYIDDANLPQRSGLRMHAIAFEDSKSSDTGGDLSYRSLVRVVCYEFGAEPMYVSAYQATWPSSMPQPSMLTLLVPPSGICGCGRRTDSIRSSGSRLKTSTPLTTSSRCWEAKALCAHWMRHIASRHRLMLITAGLLVPWAGLVPARRRMCERHAPPSTRHASQLPHWHGAGRVLMHRAALLCGVLTAPGAIL